MKLNDEDRDKIKSMPINRPKNMKEDDLNLNDNNNLSNISIIYKIIGFS